MKSTLPVLFFFCFAIQVFSQNITGTVVELNDNGNKVPLAGANIYIPDSEYGTVADDKGYFEIFPEANNYDYIIVSFVGFINDTLYINNITGPVEVILQPDNRLKEVEVIDRKSGTHISRINTGLTQVITGEELTKAACCNLSESFETNASVDVSYADAITGAKKIQFLGLTGSYVQMMTENNPNFRGLATLYGMNYIPGPWMESIQVSKGAASVVNGYESLTGQINVELKKPDVSEKFYINLLTNSAGKMEGNVNTSVKINDKWSTGVLIHGEYLDNRIDHNNDSFLDIPLIKQFNILHRWKYYDPGRLMTQFGIKYLKEDRSGGQVGFDRENDTDTTNGYGFGVITDRFEFFAKGGYTFPGAREASLAFISTLSHHRHNSFYGIRDYDATQNSIYTNAIFSKELGERKHRINTGLSYIYDDYDENLNDSSFIKDEMITGVFADYTFLPHDLFTLILGIRADKNSLYGTSFTPRLHIKYFIDEHTTFRASAGKGYRSPNVYAENVSYLASSRLFLISDELKQEEGWNYGVNATRYFYVCGRELTVSSEFYRTDFVNQVVVDIEDPRSVEFYNLDGRSYASSIQAEASWEPVKRLDVTIAWRYTDVKTSYHNVLKLKPMVNRYKGLITLSYATNLKKWQFDYTLQVNGDGRLPYTGSNPETYQRDDTYPAYFLMNAQITKYFRKWDIYAGVENLADYVQKDPVIASDQPFGDYFDTSMIWGPIHGRKFYFGIRYAIDR